ncbi:major histocompatibility complex class I-related gene protein-like isoform X2 [Amphiprion ocellaris]|uniref:major histocompatibility complex class I-related gene protein-like isoform X2 n=1 Tax=Amphiprion ocellaris TaxID=80972 RepID=UPI0024117076|nr:major histocompatibility complex class I-related gene protein-like isoform X2 [Amphiprion ocellaris]
MSGCEWDDETGESRGFHQYGYDGEDFIALDLQTLTWIAPKPQGFITKLRWDTDKARLDGNKYFIHLYPDWLKKYVQYARSFLQRTVKHSLMFSLTTSSGVPDFPEYMGSALVDEVQVGYFDSNIRTAEPKVDWMRKLMKDDPQHLEWYVNKCIEHQHFFKATIDSLMKRLNQTEGAHILQQISGCEWDEENGDIKGFQQYGFNGEDFIALDLKTLTWVAPNPLAFITKLKWDTETARLEYNKYYYIHVYSDWLKKYVNYSRSFLKRTGLPSVSLLQKTPSSQVTCHATGFYPDRADLFWRKDGEELHEDVDKVEILPNHDGTFQMSVDLNISSIAPEDWKKYDCVFQLSGVKDVIITKLDKSVIRTNWVSPSGFPAGAVIGVVVGLLLLLLCITGLFIWRKKTNGFRPANRKIF